MELIPGFRNIQESRQQEERLVLKEEELLEQIIGDIRREKVGNKVRFAYATISKITLREFAENYRIKDLAKIPFPHSSEIKAFIKANGSQSKSQIQIMKNISRTHKQNIILSCNKEYGSNINYKVIRSAFQVFPAENIKFIVGSIHITERIFLKIILKSCRSASLCFNRCVIDKIDAHLNLGTKARLQILTFVGCKDSKNMNIDQSPIFESILKFISNTSLHNHLSEIHLSTVTNEAAIKTLKAKHTLDHIKFTKPSNDIFICTTFA
ncbi:unnamed protein product [Moneuplotes crassus]|uniref:Uncharacterized protein n=1 Tax=Euplotes crassus TaxID=5936 RepID=A0AAD1XP95_EUPCR|nr:unnamed protein product [Moneuplotes crassus]